VSRWCESAAGAVHLGHAVSRFDLGQHGGDEPGSESPIARTQQRAFRH
jgi:hypothetical protein